MLTVESFAPGGKDATTIQASRVVIFDASGNPLVIAVEQAGDKGILVSHFLEPEFEMLAQAFGYDAPRVLRIIPT